MEDSELKAALLTPRIDKDAPGESVQLPTLGLEVRVRGLSRGEVLAMQALRAEGILDTQAKWEAHMFAQALTSPRMTKAEVLEWQAASPAGEMEPVSAKITKLSAMDEGADKSGVQAAGAESGDGIRVRLSDQVGDDDSAYP